MENSSPAHRQFFGDAERDFRLTTDLILELERKTGAGIGGLFRRLFSNDFGLLELTEVIRLALIGGGEEPEAAAALVQTYIPARPVVEAHTLAVAILEALWFGTTQPTPEQTEETSTEAAHA